MTRAEYDALRRAAYAAACAYAVESTSDGRSSYASHGIRCLHALNEAKAASNRVPHPSDKSLETLRTAARRRFVLRTINDRNRARARTPHCLSFYQRQLRAALHPLEVEHVRFGSR